MESIFFGIGIIIILATVGGYLSKLLKQPLIPAYIIAGVVIGPILGIITPSEITANLSEIGIAFLLFIVGLEISFKKLKDVATLSTFGGTLQVFLLFAAGLFVSLMLGFLFIEAVYIAIVLAFSSTMVVVKLLSDKRELDTLHGRIVIGLLLMQDVIAVFALAILTTIQDFSWVVLLIALFKGAIFISISLLLIYFVLPPLFKYAAKTQELLFLISVSTCFLFSIMALKIGTMLMAVFQFPFFNIVLDEASVALLEPGFSIIIGAFIAGVGLANQPYNYEIIGRVKSLKDFFATIFFVTLGIELSLGSLSTIWIPLVVLTVFLLTLKPFITMFICSLFGYRKRPSFISSISLAQISEFSLIIITQGFMLNHVSKEIFSITIILAMVSITITSYFIKYDSSIYLKFKPFLGMFDRLTLNSKNLEYTPKKENPQVIVLGYNRIGYSIVKKLRKMRKRILIVDFNPEVIKHLIKKKIHCIYGDIGDIEIIERLNLKNIDMLISTIPDINDNILIIKKLKEVNKEANVIVNASMVDEALELYDEGADYVFLPDFLGGEHVSLLLEDFTTDIGKLLNTKLGHIKELRKRKVIGHDHPRHISVKR